MEIFRTIANYLSYPFVRYALITGTLIALCSSLLGVILVLRRFSYIGDGLSHVAFGAMALASVLGLTNNDILLILPITIICAVLILKGGANKKGGKPPEEDDVDNVSPQKKTTKKKDDNVFSIDKIKSVSLIIRDMKDIDFIINKINLIYIELDEKFQNMNLIYSATEDGDACTIFHSMCDGISPLLIFIKTNKGVRFGGFTSVPYECPTTYKGKIDDTAFIFSLDKRKTYEVEKGAKAICCYKNYGPVFYGYEYCNIYLIGNFLSVEGNVAKKGDRFNTKEDYEINGGDKKFMAEEVEVFQVILEEVQEDKS